MCVRLLYSSIYICAYKSLIALLLLLSPLSLCMGVCVDASARARVYHTGMPCRGMINNNQLIKGGQDGGGMDGSRWR